jgi:hypothetical protein
MTAHTMLQNCLFSKTKCGFCTCILSSLWFNHNYRVLWSPEDVFLLVVLFQLFQLSHTILEPVPGAEVQNIADHILLEDPKTIVKKQVVKIDKKMLKNSVLFSISQTSNRKTVLWVYNAQHIFVKSKVGKLLMATLHVAVRTHKLL